MEPESGAGQAETLRPAPAAVDYVPEKPAGWTLEACPHFWNLDRLEPRPHPRRRGAQFYYIECPWCRTSATLDGVLSGMFRGLVGRIADLEAQAHSHAPAEVEP
jgi:hypothetical protein